jgi:hypothetical protein
LKPLGSNPCAYEVKNWFQSLLFFFKLCNLYRYVEAMSHWLRHAPGGAVANSIGYANVTAAINDFRVDPLELEKKTGGTGGSGGDGGGGGGGGGVGGIGGGSAAAANVSAGGGGKRAAAAADFSTQAPAGLYWREFFQGAPGMKAPNVAGWCTLTPPDP